MRIPLTLGLICAAAPVLADAGAHMHPHGTDPIWLPLLAAVLTAAGAAWLARGRK